MLKRINWATFLFLILSPIAVLIFVPLYIHSYGLKLNLALFTALYSITTSISITGGYHRLLAHKSYEAKLWVRFFYLLFGAGSLQGSAIQWCSNHRRHHKYTDTNDDPYSISKGFFFAHMGCSFYKDDPKYKNVLIPDLLKDPMMVWQDRHFFPLSMFMGFVFPTLIGWAMGAPLGGFLLAGLFRIVFTHHCTFFINSLCHTWGRKPYSESNSSCDSFIMAVLTYGEGYHNYHHQFQYDYRNGVRWYQWDPTKWFIYTLSALGWTSQMKRVPTEEIIRAQMKMDEQRLLQKGIPTERWAIQKQKLEEASKRYAQIKKQAGMHYDHLKDELKIARIEFKVACAQWVACIKRFKYEEL